jgi:chorismate synthase
MLRFLTAGESHGPSLTVIVDGLPSGLALSPERIDVDLSRRRHGYGRGARMGIEWDEVEVTSGLRNGVTTGGPLTLVIVNRDRPNWEDRLSLCGTDNEPAVTRPRPGHADLAGGMKYRHRDLRNVLERASARETAARCAAGAVARILLGEFGVRVFSRVIAVGGISANKDLPIVPEGGIEALERDPIRCSDPEASARMQLAIDDAKQAGDTLGGIFEVRVEGVTPGLGSYAQWDRRIDAALGGALLSVPSVKAVSLGDGVEVARERGSLSQDAIEYRDGRWHRTGNRAGGVEGGMTNGEPIVVRGYVKPIPTLMHPLSSVDIETKEQVRATIERSDVCVVPAAGVVGEAMVAWVLALAYREKFGGDTIGEMTRALREYRGDVASY